MKLEEDNDVLDLHQAPIAQSVERSAVNRKVAGSIPAGSGFFLFIKFLSFFDFNIVI